MRIAVRCLGTTRDDLANALHALGRRERLGLAFVVAPNIDPAAGVADIRELGLPACPESRGGLPLRQRLAANLGPVLRIEVGRAALRLPVPVARNVFNRSSIAAWGARAVGQRAANSFQIGDLLFSAGDVLCEASAVVLCLAETTSPPQNRTLTI